MKVQGQVIEVKIGQYHWSDKNENRTDWQAARISVRPAEHPKKRLRRG
jgi:hypothetical protein